MNITKKEILELVEIAYAQGRSDERVGADTKYTDIYEEWYADVRGYRRGRKVLVPLHANGGMTQAYILSGPEYAWDGIQRGFQCGDTDPSDRWSRWVNEKDIKFM